MEWRFWRKKCFICRRAVKDRMLDGSWYVVGMGREMAYVHSKCLHSLAGGIRVKIIEIEKGAPPPWTIEHIVGFKDAEDMVYHIVLKGSAGPAALESVSDELERFTEQHKLKSAFIVTTEGIEIKGADK